MLQILLNTEHNMLKCLILNPSEIMFYHALLYGIWFYWVCIFFTLDFV